MVLQIIYLFNFLIPKNLNIHKVYKLLQWICHLITLFLRGEFVSFYHNQNPEFGVHVSLFYSETS